ncbi:alpha/beta hydrolase [Pedobacter sp. ISL-68]|uniref:alpha/beta hydrolase n=1 Tax=unclassified Pedobacter TaxID=2628915 RepID=UPI001BE7609F|nr:MULTISPECIES: alpha/beta hydrolase [unclassified Pedobacter]MBT2560709.1 alpha/beta hydrolase [Pedobacter sp. ISL-64]MBT2590088.1 alpha/beta hydrolase [Pedobacter sp. ISL-68]
MKQKISFKRDGLTLVGNLFTPENLNEDGQYNAMIVQGSFTSVKEQMPNTYAEKFAEEGFVVLAFDYSHYGESEGSPRQYESYLEKTSDLKAAVSFLSDLPYVKDVSMVGVCTSAGNTAYLAVADHRIKAIATVAAFLPTPELYNMMFLADGVAKRIEAGDEAKRKFEENGEETLIAAYSETDTNAVNYMDVKGAFDYYLNTERGNVPNYTNTFNVMAWKTMLAFDPIAQASEIKVPAMVLHSDESAFPDNAKEFYSKLKGTKELVWADGNHYDYYDSEKQIDNAVRNVSRFFNEHLN